MTQDTSAMFACGVGTATLTKNGTCLEVWFLGLARNVPGAVAAPIRRHATSPVQWLEPRAMGALGDDLDAAGAAALASACRQLAEGARHLVCVTLEEDGPIASTPEAYLKLQLLSHRLALPNTLNLERIFAALPNVVWTSAGAIDPADFAAEMLAARRAGRTLTVHGVDKFPRMTDYVIPSGVRIADASRIRLGAYLGEGTTVMHEGFVNFNAGALGPNMVEGRISQGVVVGAHSDLGGSSSTMGTLSGGGNVRVSIGERCLIGANAGTGISLGDRCTIEAGLYITAGTVVDVKDEYGEQVKTVKARQLSGNSDMLFIRNSRTGAVECRTNRAAIALNAELHAHN
jgi:2,3,4,5-tetrahydropyridine-2-carboxylate N-succinyltransferase